MDCGDTSLTERETEGTDQILDGVITTDSRRSLAKPAFINSFLHLRQDVLTDGSTLEQLCALFLVQQIISDSATWLCLW